MTKDEALRLALEALEYTGLKWPQVEEAITAIEAALEAKDEPVAYVPYGVFDAWLDQAWLGVRCLNPQLCDPDKVDVQPIYAYPNSLRQPLTDEEIERIYNRYGGEMINCARAIERAHGIKGEA
jgi:hypothetical protein